MTTAVAILLAAVFICGAIEMIRRKINADTKAIMDKLDAALAELEEKKKNSSPPPSPPPAE